MHTVPESLQALPVMALAGDIGEALCAHNVLLRAEPGAGKSTGLPLALLSDVRLNGKILLLEPRRLAARSVAERLAFHLGEPVGRHVGLRMRSDTRISTQTQLEVVTEGVLTRLLQEDPSLDGVGLVIFDEFHERSLHADLGLALCLEVQQALREDLRLLLMSATLEVEQIHQHLADIRPFHCSVRQHPVDIVWVGEQKDPLPQRIVHTVLRALSEHAGDVLVFLPGVSEINRTASLLQCRLDEHVELHRLHGGIGQAAQRAATTAASATHRRVILSTSLAETSITIEGVRVVVDSGLERRGRMDSSTGAQRLETVTASQASATQRTGRAGRTMAGICYRLWNEVGHVRRPTHWQPEILRADLAPLLVELGLWGASVGGDLPWLEAPPSASLSRAEDLLIKLGLWDSGQLSAHGRQASTLPVHPRLGHMLVWANQRGAGEIACRLAIWLDEQQQQRASGFVDLDALVRAPLPLALRRRADYLGRLLQLNPSNAESPSAAVVLAQAYPDWIAQRRPGDPGNFRLACGAGAMLSKEDPLAHAAYLVVAQLGGAGSQARIFKAMMLDVSELRQHAPELLLEQSYLDWDDKQQRVLAEHRLMIGALVLETRPMQSISDTDKAKALLGGIRQRGLSCLPWTDECREWQARVQRMRSLNVRADVSAWPQLDDEALLARLDEWLLPWLQGIGSMKALQQLDLYRVLSATLDYRQQQLLDEYLPLRYTVPSGSQIRLSYIQPGNPLLSVRLQEMLGCADNPAIAQGQIALKVELLSPARRTVQVTEDLANFWTNSYPDVKKDMAGRYPKHVWPDDPLAAQATAYSKRRKRN